ncbi:disintegrin and metalloproteinase domain-containing protein 20-like [Emydura macquarii macquarii]|uniref:disintegrin and metalloproteinase domain-containing protein 20-like n=1 Tax=Emydura macquarii macquarii TaxID=1129001 RepID=UPI00352A9784
MGVGGVVWLVLLGSGSLLGGAAGSSPPGGRGLGVASYAVIVPRLLAPRAGQGSREVSYLLEVEGRGRVVRLMQKRLLVPEHFALFTYRPSGALQRDQPFVRGDCYYHGYVQGSPASLAALSTCSGGLRGMLRTGSGSYEIEPVPGSATFQHVLYRLEEEGAAGLRCALTDQELRRQAALIPGLPDLSAVKQVPKGLWWTHTRYVKLAVVVANDRFIRSGGNETQVMEQVLDIVNIADSVYDPLGVRVFLVGLEIWTQNNLITLDNSISVLLSTFNKWREKELPSRLPHDAGHLITNKDFEITLGLAFVGAMCSSGWASAVLTFMDLGLYSSAILLSHELGHNLGMTHDDGYCKCKHTKCIMNAYHTVTDLFSNCSYSYYFNLMYTPGAQCLLKSPAPEEVYTLKYCGNKVIESGEQCDCGSKFNCEKDPCCQPNCTLSASADCAFGECCDEDCQILPAGQLCRKRTNECDLPEYCNGISEWCPKDVYVQDGAPCQDSAYCYHGNCSSHSQQCKIIFGKEATVAPLVCFRELNTQGDRFGNCGIYSGTKYKKCPVEDILCGRVQCENMRIIPSLENHNTMLQTPVDNNWCWGTDYHPGMDIADIGAVRDGTSCGPEKVCINMSCVTVSSLNYDCNITKCHNRGVCNSHKNCHCNYGWAPPDCQYKGYGGSIDSGPPPPVKPQRRVSFVIPIFLAVAAVLGIGLGVYYKTALIGWLRRSVARFHPPHQADASSDGKGVPSISHETATATVSKPGVVSMLEAWNIK